MLLTEQLEARTPFTLTDRKTVFEKIKEIEKFNYSIDDEEFYLGLYCISSPIYGIGNKVIAAVGVTAPKIRMDEEKVKQLIPAIISTAQVISDDYKTLFAARN